MTRTPEDARYRPVPGDTQTDNKGRTYKVTEVRDGRVFFTYTHAEPYDDLPPETCDAPLDVWSYSASPTWTRCTSLARRRSHPRPGDTLFVDPKLPKAVVQHVADGVMHLRVECAVPVAGTPDYWAVVPAPDPQAAPVPSEGDVWDELIRSEAHDGLRALYSTRRAKGLGTYGVPLQRNNGRNFRQDLTEELLDGMAYAQGANLPNVVAALRDVLLMTEAPRA